MQNKLKPIARDENTHLVSQIQSTIRLKNESEGFAEHLKYSQSLKS